MLKNRKSVNSKRILLGVISLALLCAAIALGFANKQISRHKPVAQPTAVLNAPAERTTAVQVSTEPLPQSSAQFDLSRNVIAGGGGTSTGSPYTLDGIIGQPAAGTVMSGGNFVQAGGFWYAITSGALPSPSPTPTPAANFIVNSTDDAVDVNPGDGICETAPGNRICTLRAAIQEASSGNAIGFSLPANSTITLTSVELLINKNLTINGPGANLLTVQRSTAGGTPDFRIFDIASGNFNVTISGLTISNGKAAEFSGGGGGIFNLSAGKVNITDCTISGNAVQRGGDGGGINNGSSECNRFGPTITMNITNSIISNNSAPTNTGGGIFNCGGGGGTVTITNSTISRNSAVLGGGIFITKPTNPSPSTLTVSVTNSTISGNSSASNGGGIFIEGDTPTDVVVNITASTISGNSSGDFSGGGINNVGVTANITNSTISGNSAASTGGVRNDGNGRVNLTNSTISNNSASLGGGGGLTNIKGTVQVKNSIIAGNSDTSASPPGNHPELSGAFTSQGYNLIGNNSGATITPMTGDQIGTAASPIDPLLGSLQNNGGPTFTHALLSGSPAKDKGSAATDPVSGIPITTDQRGLPRPVDDPAIPNATGGNGSDIGAFEVQAPTPTPTPTPTPVSIPTSTGTNVTVQGNSTTITFATVTGSGPTTIAPINPSSAGQLPNGYQLSGASFAFEITTTATVYGPITICFAAPSVTDATAFSQLRILHKENEALVDRTTSSSFASKMICGQVDSLSPFVVASAVVPQLQFNAASYKVSEGAGSATITVSRLGETSGTASVDYTTSDGTAKQRTDYIIASGTVTFGPGEMNKNVTVLIVDNAYVDGNRTVNLSLTGPIGAPLGTPASVMLTIQDNDSSPPTTNPLDNADERFFVRQHFYDFLSRLPDQGGFDFWVGQITQCGTNQTCINNKRLDVSNAFFFELEYQQTGAYVFRLYRAGFGNNQAFPNPDSSNQAEAKKLPSYAVFASDRARVVGGANLAQGQLDLANVFVGRPEFLAKYPVSLDGPGFVDALLTTIKNDSGADLTLQRQALIDLFNAGGRGNVLYRLADDNAQTNLVNNRAFIDAEYNRAFVFTQYAGYLRRDADIGGFLFWLGQVNNAPPRDVNKQHAMVCSFITSAEYQQRFSSVVTHFNAECGP